MSQDATNTTHHANTTMTDLKQKIRTNQNKMKNNADDVVDGPMTKGGKGTDPTEPSTDHKLMGKKGNAKGKVSGEEKSSGDSDP